jgi:DNA adenine methylase
LDPLSINLSVYPFIKWAGGKAQLLSSLEKFIPPNFNNYFEPFLGGGSFFYHLLRKVISWKFHSFLSDTNCELISSYNTIRNRVEELIRSLKAHQELYLENPIDYYYKLRSTVYENEVEKSSRFITLNRTCFNGLYRVNRSGLFNVPMGKFKKSPMICDENNLRNLSNLFNCVKPLIECKDFKDALSSATEADFIYLDPPYKPTSDTAYFTKYTNFGFGDKDQKELANLIHVLDKRKCKVLLSNSNTELIRKLYSSFNMTEVKSMRAINSNASKRQGHTELIISNY